MDRLQLFDNGWLLNSAFDNRLHLFNDILNNLFVLQLRRLLDILHGGGCRLTDRLLPQNLLLRLKRNFAQFIVNRWQLLLEDLRWLLNKLLTSLDERMNSDAFILFGDYRLHFDELRGNDRFLHNWLPQDSLIFPRQNLTSLLLLQLSAAGLSRSRTDGASGRLLR